MAERKFCFDPKPDLDNANVGNIVCFMWDKCIQVLIPFLLERFYVRTVSYKCQRA
mgnify:CR=1 FL=1